MLDKEAIERTAEALFVEVVAAAIAARATNVDYRATAAEARKAAQAFHAGRPNY